ncbi:MAG: DUF2141 domain-containing protein, partial [Bacteroidota bacterium]|nr:DUF2141 domain-containing protein [Bacteroidota bacterium]
MKNALLLITTAIFAVHVGTKEVLVTANEMKIVFTNVPIGVYGIVAFQDIDKDKKLKSNFIGFPT